MARMIGIRGALLAAALLAAAPSSAGPLSFARFKDATGLQVDESRATSVWSALGKMGTTDFLGGSLGTFRLDESSMLAGALTLGATEFDEFLRSGSLSSSVGGLGDLLSRRMDAAAGLDLAYLVGSFTSGGGASTDRAATLSSLTSRGGAIEASTSCDPEIADKLAEIGEKRVSDLVSAAGSDSFGFSQIGNLRSPSGSGTGFAALGCLDKLFQGTGVDIFFKPPSLGNLTNMVQNWSCSEAVGIAQQVAGAFGAGEIFKTGALGGFYPAMTMGEAMDGAPLKLPGIGQNPTEVFGFGRFDAQSPREIAAAASLDRLFR